MTFGYTAAIEDHPGYHGHDVGTQVSSAFATSVATPDGRRALDTIAFGARWAVFEAGRSSDECGSWQDGHTNGIGLSFRVVMDSGAGSLNAVVWVYTTEIERKVSGWGCL